MKIILKFGIDDMPKKHILNKEFLLEKDEKSPKFSWPSGRAGPPQRRRGCIRIFRLVLSVKIGAAALAGRGAKKNALNKKNFWQILVHNLRKFTSVGLRPTIGQ